MEEKDEKPPFLKTWRNVYALVIGTLVVLIILFYLFTKYFE
jgi:hypothetical protein